MAPSPSTLAGEAAEREAARRLAGAGLVPVARNLRYKVGELDLVMRDGMTLVFVEVRTRRSLAYGGAVASIDARKQLRVRRAAQCYLQARFGQRPWPACRFDVVAFEAGEMHWLKAAFD